jgi:hypothetical protein
MEYVSAVLAILNGSMMVRASVAPEIPGLPVLRFRAESDAE